jgi:hypothetical protein
VAGTSVEARIVINGQELTDAQVKVFRMALKALTLNLDIGVFDTGDKEKDRSKWIRYQAQIAELNRLIKERVTNLH